MRVSQTSASSANIYLRVVEVENHGRVSRDASREQTDRCNFDRCLLLEHSKLDKYLYSSVAVYEVSSVDIKNIDIVD